MTENVDTSDLLDLSTNVTISEYLFDLHDKSYKALDLSKIEKPANKIKKILKRKIEKYKVLSNEGSIDFSFENKLDEDIGNFLSRDYGRHVFYRYDKDIKTKSKHIIKVLEKQIRMINAELKFTKERIELQYLINHQKGS